MVAKVKAPTFSIVFRQGPGPQELLFQWPGCKQKVLGMLESGGRQQLSRGKVLDRCRRPQTHRSEPAGGADGWRPSGERKEPGPGFRLQPSLLGQRDCGSQAAGCWTQVSWRGRDGGETSTRPEGQGPGHLQGPGPAAARGLSGARHTCVSALPGGGPLSVAGRGQSPPQRPPRGVLSAGCGPWVPRPAPGCAPSGRSLCWLLGAEDTCLTPRRDPERGRGPRDGGARGLPAPRELSGRKREAA